MVGNCQNSINWWKIFWVAWSNLTSTMYDNHCKIIMATLNNDRHPCIGCHHQNDIRMNKSTVLIQSSGRNKEHLIFHFWNTMLSRLSITSKLKNIKTFRVWELRYKLKTIKLFSKIRKDSSFNPILICIFKVLTREF